MRVLFSAYACEPHKGSEPGVGWHWAVEITRLGHEVWVLTRANNEPHIEAAVQTQPWLERIHFVYYDLPPWARWWKRRDRGIRTYYFLWQLGAYRLAKRLHRERRFELVQHSTFVSIRQPSFMGALGIPFVFGPVAGGDSAPRELRRGVGLRGRIADGLRDIANAMVRIDPFMRHTFRHATEIVLTSEQTRRLVPKKFAAKCRLQLAIGHDLPTLNERAEGGNEASQGGPRILYAGKFVYLKGMHLGLAAFAQLLGAYPTARLTMLGQGPEKKKWQSMAESLGIAAQVDWLAWVDRAQMAAIYAAHDAFLFPSLRDSGGMVVLEALGAGTPVVCLDLGGPGVINSASTGRVVATAGRTEPEVIQGLSRALAEVIESPPSQQALAARVESFTWAKIVAQTYGRYSLPEHAAMD